MGCGNSQVISSPFRVKWKDSEDSPSHTSSSCWAVQAVARALRLRTWLEITSSSIFPREICWGSSSKRVGSWPRPSIASWRRVNWFLQNWWSSWLRTVSTPMATAGTCLTAFLGISRTGMYLKSSSEIKLSLGTWFTSIAPHKPSLIAWPNGPRLVEGLMITLRPWRSASLPLSKRPSRLSKVSRRKITALRWMQLRAEMRFTACSGTSWLPKTSILPIQLKCCLSWVVLAQERERNWYITQPMRYPSQKIQIRTSLHWRSPQRRGQDRIQAWKGIRGHHERRKINFQWAYGQTHQRKDWES